jgi:hypothetical protein
VDPQGRSGQVGKFAPAGIQSPDRPGCMELLYKLRYPCPQTSGCILEKACIVDVRLVNALCQPPLRVAGDRNASEAPQCSVPCEDIIRYCIFSDRMVLCSYPTYGTAVSLSPLPVN